MAITTGIPQLDERLGGGIPKGNSLIYLNQPAVSADIFVHQAFHSALSQGSFGLFFTNVKPPELIKADFDRAGFPLDEFAGQLEFIDAYSPLIGQPSEAAYTVNDPYSMESLLDVLEQAILDHPGASLALDSLSTVVDYVGEEAFINHHERLDELLAKQTVSLACATDWDFEDPRTSETLNHMDCVVRLGGVENKVIFGHYFKVEHAQWMGEHELNTESVLFKVVRPGGVRVYIPKIVVTGPFNAGKSTFVKSLSSRSLSVERMGTTVALDHGMVDHGGVTAEVFGTPGQSRFDPIITNLARNALGMVLVVDNTRPQDLGRARDIFALLKKQGLPVIVAANKQDLEGAMSETEIRQALDIPPNIEIVPCIAKEADSVRKVFERLIQRIMNPPEVNDNA